jgi:soluble lytic murein transglycosylase-like protein
VTARASGRFALVAAAVVVPCFLGAFAAARALARSDPVTTWIESSPPDLSTHDTAIAAAATEFGIDPDLLRGLVAAESSGRADAVSSVGARGLTQLMPETAKEQAKALKLDPATVSLTDPATNLRLGARYLGKLLGELGNEPAFALAAYNAGKANVLRWRWRAPDVDAADVVRREGFGETRRYVRRVLAFRDAYRQ